MDSLRVGIGYDVHPLSEERELVIGGEKIPFPYGLAGHSDADVLIHAVIDSLLSAANMGDIGQMFPDDDERYRGISSIELLEYVGRQFFERGIEIINIDTVVICEKPKIYSYIDKMRNNIACALHNLDKNRIGIKGTTTEKLGFIGRGEGIAAQAVSLVKLY
jgi:2-C-methyl-D-erythritol 2,4-cyclodiphosphate synthase